MGSPEQLFLHFRTHADGKALAAVFDALAPELLLVAAHVAAPGTDPADLLQATFLDAIEKAARWDAARPLLPWLIGILVNHAREERRRRERQLDALRVPRAAVEPSPLDALAAGEVAEQVAAALPRLPRHLRQALTLRLVHGLSPTEIARALGCPVATAKTRLQRGTEWLRRVLPAGIAVSVAGLVTAGRGLAAVRAAVLSRAAATVAPAAAAGLAVGAIAGGLAMKKVMLAALVVVGVGALWAVMPRSSPMPRPEDPADAIPAAAHAAGDPRATTPLPPPPASERVAFHEPAAPTTGSAELQLVWKGEGTPAAGLVASCGLASNIMNCRSGESDAEGRLHFAELAAGEYQLFNAQVQHRFTIRAGEVTRERIDVEPFLRCDGIVVDGDGRGVAGAAIHVGSFFDSSERGQARPLAVTDAEGRFRGCTDHGGELWARKPGFAASLPILVRRGQGNQLRLVLQTPGARATGIVLGADAQPLVRAQVVIVRHDPNPPPRAPIVLQTDARGAFSTDELEAGEQILVARAAGHALAHREFAAGGEAAPELLVRLTPGATVFGEVHGANRSSPAAVVAQPGWARQIGQLQPWCTVLVQVDGNGRYRLQHLAPGDTWLEARGISDSGRQVQLVEGESLRCDFGASAGTITGRIVDATDQPLEHWWVHAFSQDTGHGASASVDHEGRFQIAGLAGRSYRVTAMPDCLSSDDPWIEVADVGPGAGELVLRPRFTLQDGAFVSGILLDGAGVPATEVVFSFRAVGAQTGSSSKKARMREGGAFEVGPLLPGTCELSIHAAGHGLRLGPRELAPRARIDVGTLRLPAPGILELRFVRADGTAVTPSQLMAKDDNGNLTFDFARSNDGILRAQRLPAGNYTVSAWGEDMAPVRQQAAVVAGRATLTQIAVIAATRVRFELPRPAGAHGERWASTVTLRVTDTGGEPVANTWFAIDAADAFTWTRGLLPGRYRFEASVLPTVGNLRGGEPVRGEFEVAAGAAEQRVEIRLPALPR